MEHGPTITRDDVDAAAERVGGRVRRTPVMETDGGWFKLELTQHTGTFKARGALNRVLATQAAGELDPAVGIAVASGGNAGLANAWAARAAGVPATVFVPSIAAPAKLARLAAYGAHVVVAGDEYAHAQEAALEHAERTGAVLNHAYDQPEICAGAGTVGLEIADQCPDAATVLVAVGGGGLMAGVATALGGRATVVGVEPELAPTLHSALGAGEPVDVPVGGVAADSLGARRLGSIAWDVARREGVRSVLVTDEAILEARRWLWEEHRLVVETGAAAPVAALRSGTFGPEEGERVVVVLCGANTDPSDL